MASVASCRSHQHISITSTPRHYRRHQLCASRVVYCFQPSPNDEHLWFLHIHIVVLWYAVLLRPRRHFFNSTACDCLTDSAYCISDCRGTAATTAAVVSFIILNDAEPWKLDEQANSLLFDIPENKTFYHWIEAQGPYSSYVMATIIVVGLIGCAIDGNGICADKPQRCCECSTHILPA
jgi:hypothetical protein